ncbi:MAG TPA: adenosylcobalamin-dependent ribonucleoside-diphosphate reductase [Gammaproteobacteria bacterium]|nr:adenosylcobalamin-dependent ribonucleoside-diphosphate reductase [Chromatiales bacterium]HOP16270.1 adenosylcobalamin-dependent ribonucleoside-diphosphate reductase [Gammaproteobacteria bacterium]HPQ24471.1 adenosylcobalamin-dependent ribonucleoside-diphosphate reductase [Gammaproteobacteria bacterium]
MKDKAFDSALAEHIWNTRYRFIDGDTAGDRRLSDTWRRVAGALAGVEAQAPSVWEDRFYSALQGFGFIPGGRILAGAGTGRRVTLFNCFVMGRLEDSIDSIFEHLKEGALTMQQGGGVGYDFSTLRPAGSVAHATGRIASGPVSFMHIWDAMCGTVLSTGARRGAMMATLRCDHPDIEAFVVAKQDPHLLRRFNLSVQVSDDFMQAVADDASWPLVFPEHVLGETPCGNAETLQRHWPGEVGLVACRVVRRVAARDLWSRIMRATYDFAEPGVLFIDQINRQNNLWYREDISASNPCGEIPLPPYGACNLGSINLVCFVRSAFTAQAHLDIDAISATVGTAVRMLDNAIDASLFPLPRQAEEARGSRRLGLGLTGLADALIMLGLRYDSPAARELAAQAMRAICHAAYRTSVQLARDKCAFPYFDRERYLDGAFVRTLPEDIRNGIAAHGIRNSHLTAIAPTGTISLLAGNVSSGIEPVFDFRHSRRLLDVDGSYRVFDVEDHAHALWRRANPQGGQLPPAFVSALGMEPSDHLAMQAALQPFVDSAISKTVNVPEDYPFTQFQQLYLLAFRQGLKGCTTFRPNPVTGEILSTPMGNPASSQPSHCCGIEREDD